MMWVLLLLAQDVLDGEELMKGAGAKAAPKVQIAFFGELPDAGKGTLWSSWGDGLIASNGKYYTSIGDHRGKDGISRVYEYDPASGKLRMIAETPKGHGKIHAAIHEYEGWLYFATYWGKPKEAVFDDSYLGSILMRWNLKTEQLENLGAIVPKRGLPASHFDPERALLYFHAVTPGEGSSELAVYDLNKRKLVFQGGADVMDGKRAFMRDNKGCVYVSGKENVLYRFDPATRKLASTKAKLPAGTSSRKGDELRAAARATKDGRIFGMTASGKLFVFDSNTEEVKDLGANYESGDYTAVMVLSPDEKYLYFAPGAHGSAVRSNTPVVQYDIATGTRKVLCFLNAASRKKLGYNLAGTYNLQIDATGERLFVTFNGAPGTKDTFGRPSVVVVHLPASERP